MGLTLKEKRLKTTAEFLRFGNVPARVKGDAIVVKGERAFKLAKTNLAVKKFKLKVRRI